MVHMGLFDLPYWYEASPRTTNPRRHRTTSSHHGVLQFPWSDSGSGHYPWAPWACLFRGFYLDAGSDGRRGKAGTGLQRDASGCGSLRDRVVGSGTYLNSAVFIVWRPGRRCLVLIPLHDDNPTVLWPIVTVTFIVANSAIFLYELSLDPRGFQTFIFQMGMVPVAILHVDIPGTGGYYTPFTSMFLHAGWMHLLGNMLYLWIFGKNIEDSMGHLRFISFYLLAGLAAAITHLIFNPDSTVPTIGASGAVSGILGAYLILFPHARVQTLFILGWFFRILSIPAWILLFFWIGLQFLNQASVPSDPTTGGVAYAAHIGGFLAGIALIPFFRKYKRKAKGRF